MNTSVYMLEYSSLCGGETRSTIYEPSVYMLGYSGSWGGGTRSTIYEYICIYARVF